MTKFGAPADDYLTFHIYDFEEHLAIQQWLKNVKAAVFDEELCNTTRPAVLLMAEKTNHQLRLLDQQQQQQKE